MIGPNILVVEDETDIRDMLTFSLEREGWGVEAVGDATAAEEKLKKKLPDLMLLDWMLPDISGIDLLQKLRKSKALKELPVIMLTARGEEADRIEGLEAGADDYLPKPFSIQELKARVRAVLRRSAPHENDEEIVAGHLVLSPASHRVSFDGKEINLGPTEFRILHFMMTHPDRVYSRSQLLDYVWGRDVYVEERTVDVHIRRLRKALEPWHCDSMVQTVRGAGYRFTPCESI